MGHPTPIEWTDATWNPFGGCSVTSPGCTNCYAMRIAGSGRLRDHPLYAGVTTPSKAGPVFNGKMTVAADDAAVWSWPMRWRGAKAPKLGAGKPSMIFVGDMADLFHESRPDDVIDRVFAVMALCPQHVFQVLTKRPERMRKYILDAKQDTGRKIALAIVDLLWRKILPNGWLTDEKWDHVWPVVPEGDPEDPTDLFLKNWPLFSNVWLGVSVEDQARANERIPLLLDTPAARRFVSVEPLLGAVDLTNWVHRCRAARDGECDWSCCPQARDNEPAMSGRHCPIDTWQFGEEEPTSPIIDWVIAGGESGHCARPMHPDWVRSLRDQCATAGVPFFFKQFGEWVPHTVSAGGDLGGDVRAGRVMIVHPSGREGHEIMAETGTRQTESGSRYMARVGKKAAGAMLDGVMHREFPA